MAKYVLIESRDPFHYNGVTHNFDLAKDLVKAGNDVTLFLVQNGVLTARPSTVSKPLTELKAAGVEVLADTFSLNERGIRTDSLEKGIKASELDVVIDNLADGHKVIWH